VTRASISISRSRSRSEGAGDALILRDPKRSERSFLVLKELTRRRREEVEAEGDGLGDVDIGVVILLVSLAWHCYSDRHLFGGNHFFTHKRERKKKSIK
jgi:hypothetical protein